MLNKKKPNFLGLLLYTCEPNNKFGAEMPSLIPPSKIGIMIDVNNDMTT